MSFRDEFLLSGKTYAEWSLETTTKRGIDQNDRRLAELQRAVRGSFERGIERITASQGAMTDVLVAELAHQTRQFDQRIREVVASVDDVAVEIQSMTDYLGSHLCEVRWAVERHTRVTKGILEVLLASLDNKSRQYFEQGVECYESMEYELASERFERALDANRTNHFAYQYLAFITLHADDSASTIRNFDLAQKFAPAGYHQALAQSHLARAHYADGKTDRAVFFARSATAAYPEKAAFWYELATYLLATEKPDDAVAPLRRAIETDLTYWGVVLSDSKFDEIERHVVDLLADLRSQQEGSARNAIDTLLGLAEFLPDALELMRDGSWDTAIADLERQFEANDVLGYQAIVPKAHELARGSRATGVEHLSAELRDVEATLERVKRDRAEALRSLSRRAQSVRDSYKPWDAGGGTYLLLWVGYTLVIMLVLGEQPKMDTAFELVAAMSTFIVPWFIPAAVNTFNRRAAEAHARSIEVRNQPKILALDVDSSNTKSELERKRTELQQQLVQLRSTAS